ncbi:F-box/LRR-repeat protein At3g62440 [Linum grandiflorum]
MDNSRHKRRKTRKGDDDSSSIDRLSNLPEAVIHHIFSFLDIYSAVQTSVLSRRWINTWKHVSVLNFDSVYLYGSGLERRVEKVLSLRYHQLSLSKVIFIQDIESPPSQNSLFARVSRYALSHGTPHLDILVDYSLIVQPQLASPDLLGFDSDNCSRLKTLKLDGFSFSNRFRSRSSDFLALEKLRLSYCDFVTGDQEEVMIMDPFSSLPSLKHLVLYCSHNDVRNDNTILRISGLNLLSLRVANFQKKMEISAPKLKHFTVDYSNEKWLMEFKELTLPSLDHVDIRLFYVCGGHGALDGYTKQHMIPLFHRLSNATSLTLCSDTLQKLGEISGYLEDQPSPFTRLKSLIVESLPNDMPSGVLNYLLKGSSKPVIKFTS